MPNLTAGYPKKPFLCVNDEKQIKELLSTTQNLQDWAVGLVDELRYLFCNLDAGNVMEAGSVKAENIDTRFAKIKSAQIQSLKADKIKTGTLHVTENMTIQNGDGTIQFLSDSIVFYDPNGVQRLAMGRINGSDVFVFVMNDPKGNPMLNMDSHGEAIFGGTIWTSKNCYVSGELCVGLDAKADNTLNGISFYGDALAGGSKLYAKLTPYMVDDETVGVNVTDGGLYVEGKPVLTGTDYGVLQSKITSLEEDIKDLRKQLQDLMQK